MKHDRHSADKHCIALRIVLALAILAGWFGMPCQADEATNASQTELTDEERFFENKIRPLLVQHCVDCHGPDDQSGGLRLDKQNFFARGGDSGPVVVTKNPTASRLLRAVGYQDNTMQMPPDSKLPDAKITLLKRWVQKGAYWPKEKEEPVSQTPTISVAEQIERQRRSHWSYQRIVRPNPPAISNPKSNARLTPIDRFVQSRLAEAGLSPNEKADRRVLIHRAYSVLLGLPPSYDEVEQFLSDDDPDAFPRLIDQLLQDHHYGERWARHWLDIARYGDTKGYLAGSQETRYPFAFTYRDYVIDAFNSDKPYDQFIIEQLAADRLNLEGDQRQSLAAMGLLTVGRRFMNKQADIIDDQIDVVSRGFLGITVSCARCHDHKYDPVPTADYYSLYGVLASSEEPAELPLLGDPVPSQQYDAYLKARDEKQSEVDQWLDDRARETETELRSRVADYLVFVAKSLPAYRKDKVTLQGKRGALRPAAIHRWTQYLINPAASSDPSWELMRKLAAFPPEEFAEKANLLLKQVSEDDSPPGTTPPQSLLDKLIEGEPKSLPEAVQIIGDALESANSLWPETQADENLGEIDSDDRKLAGLLRKTDAPTSLNRQQMVSHLDQGQRNQYNQMRNKVSGIQASHPGAPSRAMVLVDRAKPIEPVIFRRGLASNRGDRVPRRFLQVLAHVDGGKPFQDGSGRLELAKAIASPNNPLTARVIVNRVWQHHFGEGLVRTASDFGVRGERPTHPELLDYLAANFIADGWSIKRLHRRIMLSATWKQSSKVREQAMVADPENRLIWRMPRKRLEFEPLRDRLLFAAGRLDDRVGGRSVMIHQDATRRGLYAYIDREDVPGLLANFDVPSPDASQAQRSQTTVPQQALFLMNSAFVIEQAKALATRSLVQVRSSQQTGSSQEGARSRIRQIYRLALSRNPDDQEMEFALRFVLPSSNKKPSSESVLDPWAQLAQVLLLCNEFTFID